MIKDNDNILDVLTYMFDYLFDVNFDEKDEYVMDDASLKKYLSQVGFDHHKIDKALNWLEDIAALQDGKIKAIPSNSGMRIYAVEEQRKLGVNVIGLLMFMENLGQLNGAEREAVIEQVMRLEQNEISLSDFKWVVMMVLGNTAKADWFEAVAFDDGEQTLQ